MDTIQLIWNIVFFVIGLLALSWALAEREKRKQDAKAWAKGQEEIEQDYQQEILSIHDKWEDAFNNSRDKFIEELRQLTFDRDAAIAARDQKDDVLEMVLEENQQTRVSYEGQLGDLWKRIAPHKDNSGETWDYEELYATAATELLATYEEVDRVGKEVRNWMQGGTPFDA
jgi:hypothetical protein